ncbi:hypothetical protein J2T20_001951 [Paenibacillus wynnii]|nr:hypothetical protein [Paenibacillus wynnii]
MKGIKVTGLPIKDGEMPRAAAPSLAVGQA